MAPSPASHRRRPAHTPSRSSASQVTLGHPLGCVASSGRPSCQPALGQAQRSAAHHLKARRHHAALLIELLHSYTKTDARVPEGTTCDDTFACLCAQRGHEAGWWLAITTPETMPSIYNPPTSTKPRGLCIECGKRQISQSRYCKSHAMRMRRYGHILGKPANLKWLVHYAVNAVGVLNINETHAGLQMAYRELDAILKNPASSMRLPKVGNIADHFTRLHSRGIEPKHIIAMMAAAALYDREHSGFFRDTKAYRYGVARAVLFLAPLHRMPVRSRTLDKLGAWLIERYGGLAANVLSSLAATERRAAAMAVPLASPSPPHTAAS